MIDISVFFFFKQKTAYELRISDWSSDVCSSDLLLELGRAGDVGALADIDEAAGDVFLIHDASSNGSSPESLMATDFCGTARGGSPATCFAIWAMCGGVVPQQPPTMLSRSEEHTSELQSLMRLSYAVYCLTKTTEIHDHMDLCHNPVGENR